MKDLYLVRFWDDGRLRLGVTKYAVRTTLGESAKYSIMDWMQDEDGFIEELYEELSFGRDEYFYGDYKRFEDLL